MYVVIMKVAKIKSYDLSLRVTAMILCTTDCNFIVTKYANQSDQIQQLHNYPCRKIKDFFSISFEISKHITWTSKSS